MIDGKTRTCGLIGNPVEHTLSPVIHNTLSEKLAQNLVYVPFHVKEGMVEDAVKGARALNILGCNVTVPYKSEVIPFLKELDPLAEKIGAVNTLVSVEGGYKGYNTDMPGLLRAMESDGVQITGEKVIILGAGGVARAVAVLLAQQKAEQILITNRTLQKAEQIAQEVNGLFQSKTVSAVTLEELCGLKDEGYLAIQATSVGLHPHDDEVIIGQDAFYHKIHTAYDLIFNPGETKFMKLAAKAGAKAYNGLKMLLYQGIIAYELWNDMAVSDEIAAEIYERLKKALKDE